MMVVTMDAMQAAGSLAIASLAGLAVGFEREWSGHATGPNAHFAGVRTFFLLGLTAGTSGLLLVQGYVAAATAMIGGCVALIAFAYQAAMRRDGADVDGTTEGAALVVVALGTLAGLGQHALAGGGAAVVVFALGLKKELHRLVRGVGATDLRAAMHFSVLALVVLPLLPKGPFHWLGDLRPRELWVIVLVVAGLNFMAHVVRRTLGTSRGHVIAGLIGGAISSTAVTYQSARRSADGSAAGEALAGGALAACTVLPLRVGAVAAVLCPPLGQALWLYLLPPLAAGFLMVLVSLRAPAHNRVATEESRNPLRLGEALRLAALFQVAIMAVDFVNRTWGTGGVRATSAGLGVTDVDALTVAMARLGSAPENVVLAAQGIGIGILSNTLFKTVLAGAFGRGTFRLRAVTGLLMLAIASLFGFWLAGAR